MAFCRRLSAVNILGFRIIAVLRKKAGGHREANTIRRAPGASRVKPLPEIPVPDQTSGLLGWDRDARRPARAFSKILSKSHPFFHSILVSIFRAFCLQNDLQNGAKIIKNAFQNPFRFFNRFFMDFDLQKHAPDLAKVWFSLRCL